MGLGKEKDPMIGLQDKRAHFTVPGSPPRRVQEIESLNTLLGGEYWPPSAGSPADPTTNP
jgi:hypothetical protein